MKSNQTKPDSITACVASVVKLPFLLFLPSSTTAAEAQACARASEGGSPRPARANLDAWRWRPADRAVAHSNPATPDALRGAPAEPRADDRELRPADGQHRHAGEVGGDVDGPQPWVYYIARDEHTIRRVLPDGSGDETVRVLRNSLEGERPLAVQPDDLPPMLVLTWPGEWDDLSHPLVAEMLAGREMTEYEIAFCLLGVEPNAGERAAHFDRDRVLGAQQQWVAPYGPAADLRPEADRTFDATFSWDGWRGIRFQGTDAPPALALDNAFMARNFTPFGVAILPGEVLIFELAHEYNGYHAGIYAASLRSRTIARLTDGRNPVVVYPHAGSAD